MNAGLLAAGAAADAEVEAFVAAHPQATFFHHAAWRDLIVECIGHQPRTFVVRDGARGITGVLPAFLVRSPLHGRALVSVPYGVYGGPLASGDDAAAVEALLIDAARSEARAAGAGYVELRCLHAPAVALPGTDLYSTFLRDLPADPEECLALIPRKSRASTRQARDRHQLELVEGPRLLRGFYDLFVANKRSLGSPVFARKFFERILERFGERAMVHGVEQEGRLIAAVLSFSHRDVLMPYYSGQQPGTERIGCMNFLYWRLMEEAVKRGLRRFDFGRSRGESGAFAFKRNMGFEPTPLHYRYVLQDGAAIPSVNPGNPRFSRVQSLWSRLPLPVVKAVGPRLMRWFP